MRRTVKFAAAALAAVTLSAVALSPAAAVQPEKRLQFQNLAVRVTAVTPRMTADRQGIEVGDIIVSVDGNRVASTDDLAFFLRRAGSVARLEVIDERRPRDDPILVKVRPVNGRIGINATQVRLPAWSSRPDPTPFSAPPPGRDLLRR